MASPTYQTDQSRPYYMCNRRQSGPNIDWRFERRVMAISTLPYEYRQFSTFNPRLEMGLQEVSEELLLNGRRVLRPVYYTVMPAPQHVIIPVVSYDPNCQICNALRYPSMVSGRKRKREEREEDFNAPKKRRAYQQAGQGSNTQAPQNPYLQYEDIPSMGIGEYFRWTNQMFPPRGI